MTGRPTAHQKNREVPDLSDGSATISGWENLSSNERPAIEEVVARFTEIVTRLRSLCSCGESDFEATMQAGIELGDTLLNDLLSMEVAALVNQYEGRNPNSLQQKAVDCEMVNQLVKSFGLRFEAYTGEPSTMHVFEKRKGDKGAYTIKGRGSQNFIRAQLRSARKKTD